MRPHVQVEVVSPRLLAAVGREVAVGRVREVWRSALDQVWAFFEVDPVSWTPDDVGRSSRWEI